MGAPGLTSPIRKETFQNLQLNAGIFIKNFDYATPTDAETLKTAIASAITAGTNILGATRGGGSFTATRDIRTPEVDGMRYGFIGSDFVDSVDAYLSTTLIEVTIDGVKACLGNASSSVSGKKTTITMHTAIQESDYINNLVWIGDLADGRLVLIALKNALNTADFSLTFTDKGEGTLAAEFHARQAEVNDYDDAPFEIVFFETSGDMGSLTVTSSAGANVGGTALSTTYSLTAGQHFVYKIGTASSAPSIGYHEEPDYTWTEWDGSSEIAVGASANGKKATVAVVNSSRKALMSGVVTLAVKTA
ncbi:MAG: hypothetical protein IKQ01_06530 [Bacteroidales bacterium]|nr:hypothetical protein [Bacteroidales bacterium]